MKERLHGGEHAGSRLRGQDRAEKAFYLECRGGEIGPVPGVAGFDPYHMPADGEKAAEIFPITGVLKRPGGVEVEWQGGVQARQYLETRTDLGAGGPLPDWVPILTNEPPTPVTGTHTDTAPAARNNYRIKTERP